MDQDQIIEQPEYPNYTLTLYTTEESELPLLDITTNTGGFIELDLTILVEDISLIFEQGNWTELDSTTHVGCRLCKKEEKDEPNIGTFTIQDKLNINAHKTCINTLEQRIMKLCQENSNDIVSRI